jgi:hypothetical protein
MTYRRMGREWLIDLWPLSHTPCHKIVTEVPRLLRPSLSTRQATYLVWLLPRLPVLLVIGSVATKL